MDEAKLVEKLRLIEALFSGATTAGERDAAGRARERIIERLVAAQGNDPPVEYRFTMADQWSRRVFVTLLRRYGIRPYRYGGQRHTTVNAKVPQRFVDETLWPEFQQISETLRSYLAEVTDRVVAQVLEADGSEADVVDQPRQLSLEEVAGASTDSTAAGARSASAEPDREAATASSAAEPMQASSSNGAHGDSPANKQAPAHRNPNRDRRKRKKKRRR